METSHQGGISKQRVMGLVLTGRWLSAYTFPLPALPWPRVLMGGIFKTSALFRLF